MIYDITISDIQKIMQDKLIKEGYFKNRTHLTRACVRKIMILYTGEDNPLKPIKSSVE